MAEILDGKMLSNLIKENLTNEVALVKTKLGFTPILATILVGNDESSIVYVNMKTKACEKIGLDTMDIRLEENTTTNQLIEIINKLNNNDKVVGILLQHPVPKQIDERACFNAISESKDVDGVNATTFGKYCMGEDVFLSATPLGILKLLDYYKINVEGLNVSVVGRSAILGKPLAMALLNRNATVTICHSHTKDLPNILKNADIVVGAVGKPNFIKRQWLKEGVILIDAGYNKGNIGDIDLCNCTDICSFYTPVPGGVGPLTIASLLSQTVESAKKLIK